MNSIGGINNVDFTRNEISNALQGNRIRNARHSFDTGSLQDKNIKGTKRNFGRSYSNERFDGSNEFIGRLTDTKNRKLTERVNDKNGTSTIKKIFGEFDSTLGKR